jgi:type I restriction enzyme S subunit
MKVKLKEVVDEFIVPMRDKPSFVSQGVPWCRIEDIDGKYLHGTKSNQYLAKEIIEKMNLKIIPKNSVLFTCSASVGIVTINTIDLCTNQTFIGLVPSIELNKDYLYYALRLHKKNFLRLASVTTIPYISREKFENFEIEIHDLQTRNSIADILSAIDSKIELNNRINAELEAMAKTIYDYWFVQFDFPNNNGKPYKSSGGKMTWNEELKREIPEGWDSIMIGNCLLKESSIRKIPTAEILENGKYPVVDQSTHFITGFTNDKEAIIKTDVPRIIFGDHTRILKLINFDFARGADGTQVMLSNNKRMPQHLFFNTLLKIDLSNYGYARHYKFLKDISIILPDETVSKSFEANVSPFYAMIRENIFQNQKLTELRDWLLPMLMNGQVKVN